MAVEVALAMLQRDGRWLMQLRDELPSIVAPGCWGLFGGHLDPGETPEQAMRRELLEEISWQRRCQRWLSNERIDVEALYGPLILWALQHWQKSGQSLHLALDTTMLWNWCCVVVLSVVAHAGASQRQRERRDLDRAAGQG
jgi:8-oxo-dGTP diphosphatase